MIKYEDILRGDIRAAARLMRDIDDETPSARDMLKKLYRFTGHSHILGITGSPGTGKSTLVDRLIQVLREKKRTVGVVAIDPTSPFTGGAILGDRVRMQRHATDEGVFIRSLATRGHTGGISRSTHDIVSVMDAMGKDVIIVETVGVGQDGVEIIRLVHTSIVVVVPGMGDGIQAIKAGLLEVGDIFVVNKADIKGADQSVHETETTIRMKPFQKDNWVPPVLKTDALRNRGIKKLLRTIDQHRKYLQDSFSEEQQQKRSVEMFKQILRESLFGEARGRLKKNRRWEETLDSLMHRRIDPYSAAEAVIKDILKGG